MKKTLVALAAFAATGAFAQVAITGSIGYGYGVLNAGNTTNTQNLSGGLGLDDATLKFTASEDLGGGMKVTAFTTIDGSAGKPGTTAAGMGDTAIALTTGFGVVGFNTVKSADYLSGGHSNVGGAGWDGRVFNARSWADSVSLTIPVGAFQISLGHQEAAAGIGEVVGGAGTTATTGQRLNSLGVTYASGKLAAAAGYLQYDSNGVFNGATPTLTNNVIRARVSYDFGSFQVGAGVARLNLKDNLVAGLTPVTADDMALSVGMPLGNFNVGANWASRKVSDHSDVASNGSNYGTSVTLGYNLSKRTSLSFSHRMWTGRGDGTAVGAFRLHNSSSTESYAMVYHTF